MGQGKNVDITAIVIGVLTISATIIGVYIGQSMAANNESDKLIREKLEKSYQMVLQLPKLAVDFNMSATNKLDDQNFEYNAGNYNHLRNIYSNEIAKIKSISDLYAPSLSDGTDNLIRCSKKFINLAANHMLLEARDSGREITHELMSYAHPSKKLERNESLNSIVAARLQCDKEGETLKKAIVKAMKNHI